MKLYAEEQVREAMKESRYAFSTDKGYDEILESLTPIELPSDEEIMKQSEFIAHNYFDMHNTNHYQGLKEGSHKMAKWLKEQILNQNK